MPPFSSVFPHVLIIIIVQTAGNFIGALSTTPLITPKENFEKGNGVDCGNWDSGSVQTTRVDFNCSDKSETSECGEESSAELSVRGITKPMCAPSQSVGSGGGVTEEQGECLDCSKENTTTPSETSATRQHEPVHSDSITTYPTPTPNSTGAPTSFSDIWSRSLTIGTTDSSTDVVNFANDRNADGAKAVQSYSWPVKKEAVVEGDVIIGGLMMVHEREDSITCGPIMPQGGVQALETMLYTIDQVNANNFFVLPNISLGAHVLDDCDKDTYGLEMAVDFIKGEDADSTSIQGYQAGKTVTRTLNTST